MGVSAEPEGHGGSAAGGPVVHPTAIVEAGARIGDGTRIWHWVHVCPGAAIGTGCSLGQGVFVGNRVVLGNNVRVQNHVSIYDDVTLEDDVFCGPSMVFTNVVNPRSHVPRKHEYRPTRVARGASIGANATIVCGVTIGEYAFVGAGAVVSRDVAPYSLVTGVPARHRGWVCRCGVTLNASSAEPAGVASGDEAREVACVACGAHYRIDAHACVPQDTPSPSTT
ncbi:MAG: acyltransferase [Lautropia sp.]